MFTTLDQLEHHQQQKHSWFTTFRREIKIVASICIAVFVVNSLVTNAQLYAEAVQTILQSTGVRMDDVSAGQTNDISLSSLQHHTPIKESIIDQDYLQNKIAIEQMSTSLEAMNLVQTDDFSSDAIIGSSLKKWLGNYSMQFNMLPPTDRIMISRLAIDAPLIQSSARKAVNDLTKEDFDKDLYHGVVQYPTTPDAGQRGNMLVFGHTSYESWKSNPYATIFSGLPKLENDDIIEVVSDGKIYHYKVIAKKIVSPNKVDQEYKKYTDGEYMTLLWCYPIWSDAQRIMIIGELVK